jgi:hypothetical protein
VKTVVFETNQSTAAHRLPSTRIMVSRRARSPALPRTVDSAAVRGLLEIWNDGVKVSGTAVFRMSESPAGAEAAKQSGVGGKGGVVDRGSAASRTNEFPGSAEAAGWAMLGRRWSGWESGR